MYSRNNNGFFSSQQSSSSDNNGGYSSSQNNSYSSYSSSPSYGSTITNSRQGLFASSYNIGLYGFGHVFEAPCCRIL